MTDPKPDPIAAFEREVDERIEANGRNRALREASQTWLSLADDAKYEYNFSWFGRPLIQYPHDLMAVQELIWRTQPQTIVETGIAHGGMTLFLASMLRLLGGERRVIAVDVDIRAHNRAAIEAHPLFDPARVELIEGDSIDPAIVARVAARCDPEGATLVCLDSNHTHAHVLAELDAYAPLVGRGHYVIVFDTTIETLDGKVYPDRPWRQGDSPLTAVDAFLASSSRFVVDERITNQLLVTSAPGGFLRCVEDRT